MTSSLFCQGLINGNGFTSTEIDSKSHNFRNQLNASSLPIDNEGFASDDG